MQQLLLFQDTTEQILEREVKVLKDQCERIRKGQYAKISQLTRQVKEMQNELEFLKSNICRTKKDQLDLFSYIS